MNTEDATELCPKCLRSTPTASDLCGHCGAPLTSRAVTDPVLSIAAEGYVIRSAVAQPHRRMVVVGIWLMALPALAAVLVALANTFASPNAEAVLGAIAALGLLSLWGAIVTKTTRNYFRLRRAGAPAETLNELEGHGT